MTHSGNPHRPLVQAALNGWRAATDHPGAPMSVDDFVRDAVAVVAAGAGAIHLHPRNPAGEQTVDPAIVNDLVARAKAASGVPIGVTTGEWIEPDLDRRVAQIRGWTAPDYASVNLSEDGAVAVMEALLAAGVGIEAGLAEVADVDLLAQSGLADRVTRILVEPWSGDHHNDVAATLATARAIHAALDAHGIPAPRLQHGDEAATWTLLRDALSRGLDTRIGLEDTAHDPAGNAVTGNAALVAAAIAIRDEQS